MIKRKKSSFFKAITISMLGLLSFCTVVSNSTLKVSAHNAYFLSITIDETNFRYTPTVVYDDNSFVANNHTEADLGNFSKLTTTTDGSVTNFTIPVIDYSGNGGDDDIKSKYSSVVADGDGDKALAFSFPGLHSRGFVVDKRDANGNDKERVDFMANYLVGGLNDAISFTATKAGGLNKFTSNTMKNKSVDLAQKAYNVQSGSSSSETFTLGSTNFTITKTPSSMKVVNGTKVADYVRIASGSEFIDVMCNAEKGYQSRDDIPQDYKDTLKDYQDPLNLNWKYIVLQGNYNADVKGITFSSINEIIKPNKVSLWLGEFFGGLLDGLRSFLGLYNLNDIMLNTGVRDSLYYYGVMPHSWMNSASALHFICQIIAWSIMGFSFVKLLFKRQLATMNVGERISLMEGFKDMFVTAFMLGAFIILFNAMIRINYSLVRVFGASSAFSDTIGYTQNMSTGVFATIVINFVFFVLSAYFNFIYITRAFTVAILYSLAPITIVCISLGGRFKSIFSNFMKELVANIFLQSIHAMCVAFFTSVNASSKMRTFELFAVLCTFIPITNFIRQAILGLPGGITDQASSLMNMSRAVVGGAVGGMVGGAISKKSGSGSFANIGGNSAVNQNIARKISDNKVSPSSSSQNIFSQKANEMATRFGGGTIDNSELKGNIEGVNTENASRHIMGSGQKDKASAVLSGVGSAVSGVASLSSAIGFGAIGDKRGMESLIKSGSTSFGNARSSFSSLASTGSGARDVYADDSDVTVSYNAHDGVFDNEGMANSDYGLKYKAMYDAMSGNGDYHPTDGKYAQYRNQAVNYYKKQGIKGAGYYRGKNGDNLTSVVFDKSALAKRNNDFRAMIPDAFDPSMLDKE